MIVSVTTLGSTASGLGRAASQVVGYLEGSEQDGRIEQRRSQSGSQPQPLISNTPGSYYADSAERPGIWRGTGAVHFGLDPTVTPEAFHRTLQGQHPQTGTQLVGAQGSNGRTQHRSPTRPSRHSSADDPLTTTQVAELAGVDVSHIRRLAARTTRLRATQEAAHQSGEPVPDNPTSFLDANKDSKGHWATRRDEAERFAANRHQAKVVMGYDVTWSAPKSVSTLYAQGTTNDRQAIEESMEAAVTAGMHYLEANAIHVRRNRGREKASNMVAASYRHYTNRALEPQLHEHVVIANMATNKQGQHQAIDARGLFAHATTAGYLAAAELRHQLTTRLGVAWSPTHNGIADIDGIDRDVIMAISSRRKAVLSLAQEMGYDTANAHQTAALATRPSKDRSVEADELHDRWRQVLNEAGFDQAAVEALRDRQTLPSWTPADGAQLFDFLASSHGITEQKAVFDRRDVIQTIASHSENQLDAADLTDLADYWLQTRAVVPLQSPTHHRGETIGSGAAQVSLAPDEQRYSTPAMLDLEERVIVLHQGGIGQGFAEVDPSRVEKANTTASVPLGVDQAAMIRSICSSGDQFQAAVGRAGAGKTTAIRAAATAWQDDGYEVRGAAPFADAARKLEAETGLRSTTLEGLLTRLDAVEDPSLVINVRTVVIVDEASTIGNRQLDRLYRHATATGATIRTIGDPHQHQSVEAGGLWKHITSHFADRTPALDTNRRQTGPEMGQVRLALDQYRHGMIAAAMKRLDDDHRIIVAPTWEELLDTMATDWFVDQQRHTQDGVAASRMIAERNSDRHALNQRAQALLRADGQLREPVSIGEAMFHVGDQVVAQTADRDLRPPNATPRDFVINGSQGTVTAIKGKPETPDLMVDFDSLGPVLVPREFIATEVGPGRGGGLTPAYAVTSFKAEGQTYDTGRNLAAPGTVNPEGMYVALTRGRNDQRTYSIDPASLVREVAELPVIADDRTALEALNQSLNKTRSADLATVVDPTAARIHREALHSLGELTGRALNLAEMRIAGQAGNNPDSITVAALGRRPPDGDHRTVWDYAVGQAAIYRSRWNSHLVTQDGSVASPGFQAEPQQHEHHAQVQASVDAAGVARLDHLPLRQILDERRSVRTSLPPGAEDALAAAQSARSDAATELDEASRDQNVARHDLNRAHQRLRPLNRDHRAWRNRARQDLQETAAAVASAEIRLGAANKALAVAEQDNRPRHLAKTHLAAYERSLDRRIQTAVQDSAPYLTGTLGQRPVGYFQQQRWDRTATSVESYRHKQLGLTPVDGPLSGKGSERAIGSEPKNPFRFRLWKRISDQIRDDLTQDLPRHRELRRSR